MIGAKNVLTGAPFYFRSGVIVMNTPGGNTSAAAELTMSLMMNMARQIPQVSEGCACACRFLSSSCTQLLIGYYTQWGTWL